MRDRNEEESAVAQLLAYVPRLIKKAGVTAAQQSIQLGYTLVEPGTPLRVRVMIVGALTYIVLPTDAIPDFMPGVGFSDDMTALAACFAAASGYITDDIRARAAAKTEAILSRLRATWGNW